MEIEYGTGKKDGLLVERKSRAYKNKLQISSEFLNENDAITPQLNDNDSEPNTHGSVATSNGSHKNKLLSKGSKPALYIKCSAYEKKLIKLRAKRCRLSVSEFCRRALFRVEIKERMSDQHIEIYKNLAKWHHDLKSAGTMFGEKDPELTKGVNRLADQIKVLLLNITR